MAKLRGDDKMREKREEGTEQPRVQEFRLAVPTVYRRVCPTRPRRSFCGHARALLGAMAA